MPKRDIDTGTAVDSIIRLRRVARDSEATRRDVEPVVSYLEEIVGPTLNRAETARLLGISHTALDRWIEKGDISVVLTPTGRREVPLSQVVDLVDQLNVDDRRSSHRLAEVIRDRRREADAIPEEAFLPPRRSRPRTHKSPELHSLAYHRLVARRLDQRLVSDARKRLTQWKRSGRIDPRWADAWEQILAMSTAQIAKTISADTERGRALRQTSPFAGALNAHERRRVVRAVEERTR